jgi:lysyl-tRNA synthetase class 2
MSLSWDHAKKRAEILANIRSFFAIRKVIEVETPLLSQGTITDVHLDAFTTNYNYLSNSNLASSAALYLQTSPEFSMKRLLSAGYGCIYQITKAFRHEGYGRHHNPEFTMLEWYRLGYDHFKLMAEVGELLVNVLNCAHPNQTSYQSLFLETVGIDPLDCTKAELLLLIERYHKTSEWLIVEKDNDILLQFIFSEIIEPTIGIDAPLFVHSFPVLQASLAQINKYDARVADRFECYYLGIELANGFNELTDAKQQLLRFEEDNIKRKTIGVACRPIDQRFIDALEHGLPQCSGVALGIDRLIMIALDSESIGEVLSFSIEQA